MKKLNNKGYMLVEIILASVLAFGVAYFIIDLTIKLKNKNDDLVVETQVVTDQTIIYNKLMKYIKEPDFSCDNITIEEKTIKYKDELIDIVNKYTTIGEKTCTKDDKKIEIKIPLEVKQQKNKDYDVNINYKYKGIETKICSKQIYSNGPCDDATCTSALFYDEVHEYRGFPDETGACWCYYNC